MRLTWVWAGGQGLTSVCITAQFLVSGRRLDTLDVLWKEGDESQTSPRRTSKALSGSPECTSWLHQVKARDVLNSTSALQFSCSPVKWDNSANCMCGPSVSALTPGKDIVPCRAWNCYSDTCHFSFVVSLHAGGFNSDFSFMRRNEGGCLPLAENN